MEPLIQDWEVPWRHGEELMRFAIDNVDLAGRPWAAVPIKAPRQPTLYPIKPNELYFNLGCYCQVQRPAGMEPYHYTKILDRKCFELGGIKMLYSSSFLSEAEFDALYNGAAYREAQSEIRPGRQRPNVVQESRARAALARNTAAARAKRATAAALRDFGRNGIRDEAADVRVVVHLREIVGRHGDAGGPHDLRPQRHARDRELPFGVLLEHADGFVAIGVERQLAFRRDGEKRQHVTRGQRSDERLLGIHAIFVAAVLLRRRGGTVAAVNCQSCARL